MTGSAKGRYAMNRLKISAALLTLGLTAACGLDSHDGPLTPVSNPSLTSVNQPVVSRTDYVLDLSTGGGLSPAEQSRLNAWFGSLQLGYGDRVYVDGGYADPQARDDVARIAGGYGLLLSEGAPVLAGAPQPGTVRVVVSRSVASVPGCPIWEDPQIGQSTRTSTNYGCAINSNIAQMVADPNDLVLGQTGPGVVDGRDDAAVKAIKGYRDRALSGAGGTAVKAEGTN
jgi:pilus assembly protein CpaD